VRDIFARLCRLPSKLDHGTGLTVVHAWKQAGEDEPPPLFPCRGALRASRFGRRQSGLLPAAFLWLLHSRAHPSDRPMQSRRRNRYPWTKLLLVMAVHSAEQLSNRNSVQSNRSNRPQQVSDHLQSKKKKTNGPPNIPAPNRAAQLSGAPNRALGGAPQLRCRRHQACQQGQAAPQPAARPMRVRLAVDRRRSCRSFASDSPSPSISPCIAHLTPASLPDFLSPSHDLAPVYYRPCSRPSARQPQAPAITGKASTTSAVSHHAGAPQRSSRDSDGDGIGASDAPADARCRELWGNAGTYIVGGTVPNMSGFTGARGCLQLLDCLYAL
jgi:hypothetical protein